VSPSGRNDQRRWPGTVRLRDREAKERMAYSHCPGKKDWRLWFNRA
jgi:hypothetical protein